MKKFFLAICSLLLIVFSVQAQSGKTNKQTRDTEKIKQLLDSKEYIFKAQSVNPARGSMRQLTSDYDIRLLGDTLVAYLPYFGRAYSAPINLANSGIQFTSTQFEYVVAQRKKGWDVTLQPKDESTIQQLILSVSQSGRATLQVISTYREAITFNGFVAARK